jgi:hypothetical protein
MNREDWRTGALIFLLFGNLSWYTIDGAVRSEERKGLKREVERFVDRDRNGKVSREEWEDAYMILGRVYDGKEARDLTNEELKRYLGVVRTSQSNF